MNKTSQKVTKNKDPKRVDAERKGRENLIKKIIENILNDAKMGTEILPIQAMKLTALLSIQAMKLPALLTMQTMKLKALPTPPPQDQMILMSMVLIYLLPLPLLFVYFLHITLSLKIKNPSMKNMINKQNDVLCFRNIIIINE